MGRRNKNRDITNTDHRGPLMSSFQKPTMESQGRQIKHFPISVCLFLRFRPSGGSSNGVKASAVGMQTTQRQRLFAVVPVTQEPTGRWRENSPRVLVMH